MFRAFKGMQRILPGRQARNTAMLAASAGTLFGTLYHIQKQPPVSDEIMQMRRESKEWRTFEKFNKPNLFNWQDEFKHSITVDQVRGLSREQLINLQILLLDMNENIQKHIPISKFVALSYHKQERVLKLLSIDSRVIQKAFDSGYLNLDYFLKLTYSKQNTLMQLLGNSYGVQLLDHLAEKNKNSVKSFIQQFLQLNYIDQLNVRNYLFTKSGLNALQNNFLTINQFLAMDRENRKSVATRYDYDHMHEEVSPKRSCRF